MDQFMKMRKKMSMAESTRQVLNKSIDLLHKLSNKKMSKESAKKEISTLLSHYFTSFGGESSAIDDEGKVKLEMFLDQAFEIIDKTDSGDAPLYEAIMMMNKVVVNNQVSDIPETQVNPPQIRVVEETPIHEEYAEEDDFISSEFDPTGTQSERITKKSHSPVEEKSHAPADQLFQERESRVVRFKSRQEQQIGSPVEVGDLVDSVLRQKEALENSIENLNDTLSELGFELKALNKE